MKNIIPTITEYPKIEVLVENSMFADEIKTIKKRLEITLAKYLHNGDITINIRVAEASERQKILLPKEAMEEMEKDFESFAFLKQALELELE